MIRFGRHRFEPQTPFSGRYLTRLLIMAGFCLCAIVILELSRYRQRLAGRDARQANGARAEIPQTAIPPSPFDELGVGVIVADDTPQETGRGVGDRAVEATGDQAPHNGLPAVDQALLQDVVDKVRRLRMEPYYHLVTIAVRSSPQLLEQHARRDLTFAHLWSEPDQYRGQLIYLKGYLRGLKKFEADRNKRLNPEGIHELYQGDLFTDDSTPNPYVIIVPSVAEGMPLGANLAENVTFAGYFLQLWRYTAAGDVERAAPLLVGRILLWTPAPRQEPTVRLNAFLAIAFVLVVMGTGGAVWAINRRNPRGQCGDGPADQRAEDAARDGLARLEKQELPDPFQPPYRES